MAPEKRVRLGGVIIFVGSVMLLLAAVLPMCPWARRRHAGLVDTKETTQLVEQTGSNVSATKTTTTERAPGVGVNAPQAVATLGMLLLLMGVPLRVPQLLHDGTQFSALRVVFYGVAGLFGVLAVRAGWDAQSIADIKIDPAWAALLSIAFAAKAAQSFAAKRNASS